MKNLLVLFYSSILVSCTSVIAEPIQKGSIVPFVDTNGITEQIKPYPIILSLKELLNPNDSTKSYISIKTELSQKTVTDTSLHELTSAFESALLNKIIPYWKGTEWTFEGHTDTPQKGSIACGYFVSTTLKHAGLNVNRYKLAWQYPINEAKSLACGDSLIEIESYSPEALNDSINNFIPEGIHFIGFDSQHVGYLYKTKHYNYFIHSNYLSDKGVCIELLEESKLSSYFNFYTIAKLSMNPKFLKKWYNKTNIDVYTR